METVIQHSKTKWWQSNWWA